MVTQDGFLSATTHTVDVQNMEDPLPYKPEEVYGKGTTNTNGEPIKPAEPQALPDQDVANGTDLGNNNVPETTEQRPEPEQEDNDKYADLDDYFKGRFGVGLEDVVTLMQDLGQFRNETLIRQQEQTLRSEWGNNYDDYFAVVRQKFEKLPEAQKAAYDNVDGARRLLAEYMMYEAPEQSRPANNFVRNNVRRMNPANQAGYDYRRSEILEMAQNDPKRYDSEAEKITRAYSTGRVLLD